MGIRVVLSLTSVCIVIPLALLAQQGGRGSGPGTQGRGFPGNGAGANVLGRGAPRLVPDNQAFDPHDLNGVWLGNKYGYNATSDPIFTPEGKKRFDEQKPSY